MRAFHHAKQMFSERKPAASCPKTPKHGRVFCSFGEKCVTSQAKKQTNQSNEAEIIVGRHLCDDGNNASQGTVHAV
jgi:hypothetical protein